MADIYLGTDSRLGREVAIKILRPELSADDDYIDRFRDEARAAARLNHPNIVSVFDWGSDAGDAYIVMEWVDGPTLADVLRAEAPLTVERACGIGADVAAALEYAHSNDVVHRDIKPSNVLLAPTGHAKVTDFGIAKAADRSTVETNPGIVLGTPAYVSPEQLRGEQASARSDIYSLGAVLFEMVTGRKPFVGDTPAEVSGNVLHGRPPRPSAINAAVPAAFEGVLSKALAKDPADRYQSAAALRADLQRFAAGPAAAPVDATTAMATTTAMAGTEVVAAAPPKRRGAERWLLIGVLLLVIAAVIIALLANNKSSGGGDVTVPNLVNVPQAQAETQLHDKGLKTIVTPQPDPGIKTGNVVKTDPGADAKVNKGTTVNLFVSSGPATTTTRRPTPTTRRTIPPTTEAPTTEATTPTTETRQTVTIPITPTTSGG